MLTGAILAGGENRRMNGEAKALLTFGAEKLIQRQIRQMREICSEMIVVTNRPKLFLPVIDASVRLITDYFPDKGPLGGLHAALNLAKFPNVWAVGCDMPFVSAKAARAMLEWKRNEDDAVVPVCDGDICPLHAIYDKRVAEMIANLLTQERKPDFYSLLSRIRWSEMTESDFLEQGIGVSFAWDFDTWDEYEALKADIERFCL